MGADIHVCVERRGVFGWVSLPIHTKTADGWSEVDSRSYARFSVLGYVGRGHHEPLTWARGVPADANPNTREELEPDMCHSPYWATWAQLKQYLQAEPQDEREEIVQRWARALYAEYGPLLDTDRVVWAFDN